MRALRGGSFLLVVAAAALALVSSGCKTGQPRSAALDASTAEGQADFSPVSAGELASLRQAGGVTDLGCVCVEAGGGWVLRQYARADDMSRGYYASLAAAKPLDGCVAEKKLHPEVCLDADE